MRLFKVCLGVLLCVLASIALDTAITGHHLRGLPLPNPGAWAAAALGVVVLLGGRMGKEPGGWRLGGKRWSF